MNQNVCTIVFRIRARLQRLFCAQENRKNTSMSLMKAIWQAKGVTPTFLGANKKSDFSNALPYWPTTNKHYQCSRMPLQQKDFCSSRRTRKFFKIFKTIKVIPSSKEFATRNVKKVLDSLLLCAFIFRIRKQRGIN